MKQIEVFNLAGVKKAILQPNIKDLIHDEALDQSETLSFNAPVDTPLIDEVIVDGHLVCDARRFRVTSVKRRRVGPKKHVFVEAESLWYELLELKRVGGFQLTAVNPSVGLQAIVAGSNWIVNEALGQTPTTGSYSMSEEDKSYLELIRIWGDITGTKPVFDTQARIVSLQVNRGNTRGESFRYGRNITEIEKEVKPPAITILYPYGVDELSIAGVNGDVEYIEDFTYYTSRGVSLDYARANYSKIETLVNDSILTDTELLTWAQAQLAPLAQGNVFYKAKIKDLTGVTGFFEDRYRAADRLRVWDEEMDINLMATVVRIKRYLNEPRLNEVELEQLAPLPLNRTTTSRPSNSRSWELFGHKSFEMHLRNDGVWTVNVIHLRFREQGEAFFGLGVHATGVGDGTLHISIEDTQFAEQTWPVMDFPYTDGQQFNPTITFFYKQLLFRRSYTVRMWTTASGGPSPSAGVNITEQGSHFWIHARGAVQETPTLPNSVSFYANGSNVDTGTAQQWTVPDGVTEILIEAQGGHGGGAGQFSSGDAGPGAKIVGRFNTTPGTTYDIYVGKWAQTGAGWPNGGHGGTGFSTDLGGGGGGSTHVVLSGGSFSSAIIVAAGGGGDGYGTAGLGGGAGGWVAGAAGGGTDNGEGATQFAGGALNGAFNQGGAGGSSTVFPASGGFPDGQGGGGGGWYGGGGGGTSSQAGGGGGGSSWLDFGIGTLEEASVGTGSVTGTPGGQKGGYVTISWETPIV